MPRKGWSQFDAPSGWVQILRGPRPRAPKWPRASSQHRRQPAVQGQKVSAPPLPQTVSGVAPLQLPSRSPVTVVAEAVAEVKQLQAAIGVLGENSVHAKALQDALHVAQNKAKLPPIQDQVESCKTFLERARKRVLRAQVVIDRAIEQKAIYELEVAEGQRRFEALQVEAAQMPNAGALLQAVCVVFSSDKRFPIWPSWGQDWGSPKSRPTENTRTCSHGRGG